MKNYLIALLLAVSLMSMQSASAAMLTLTPLNDSGNVLVGSGTSVSGSSLNMGGRNSSFWSFEISDLGPSGLVNLDFFFHKDDYMPAVIEGWSLPSFRNVGAGEYTVSFLPLKGFGNVHYDFTIMATDVISQVPVPAAAWLFGSALLGLMGMTSRKSQPMLAA